MEAATGGNPDSGSLAPFTPNARLLCGDVIDVLNRMPEESVHCIVTSPPYYGLRDYGVPGRVWGGDGACAHEWETVTRRFQVPGGTDKQRSNEGSGSGIVGRSGYCKKCGAWEGCLGLEPTLEEYVTHLVDVFRAARRVLRDDGTLWLNLGDSYAGGGRHEEKVKYAPADAGKPKRPRQRRLTNKDLLMVPARAAIALQDDGWILRQDNIWAKGLSFCPSYSGSVMPESTRDRTTWAHEHVFQLCKSQHYFYNQDAAREPYAASTIKSTEIPYSGRGQKNYAGAGVQNPSDVKRRVLDSAAAGAGRNLRNVWVIGKQAFKGAHFATFPEGLITPIVQLATSSRCCTQCGAPWTHRVVLEPVPVKVQARFEAARDASAERTGRSDGHTQRKPNYVRKAVGESWDAGCQCGMGTEPGVVLDTFAGSGRAGIAAIKLGRHFIGIDVNPTYVEMAEGALREAGAEVG